VALRLRIVYKAPVGEKIAVSYGSAFVRSAERVKRGGEKKKEEREMERSVALVQPKREEISEIGDRCDSAVEIS
jgi:hypothetical protein